MFSYKILDISIYLMCFSFMYLLYELFPKILKSDYGNKTFITYFRSILLIASSVMFVWLLFNKERFHWTFDIATGEPVDHYSTYGRCIIFTIIALVGNMLGIGLQLKRKGSNRKRLYNIFIIVLVACLVISLGIWLKMEWNDTVIEQKEIPVLEVADLKQGDEFQFRDIPWGASVEEVKAIVTSAHFLTEYSPNKQYLSTESYLLMGKDVNPIYHFEDDKLVKVQFVYGDINQKKQFNLLVEELTEVFGPTEKVEDTNKDQYYVWSADNTVMQINTVMNNSMIFYIYSKASSRSETSSFIDVGDLEPLTIRAIRSSAAPSGGAFVKKSWVNANPWTEDTELAVLPVFVNTWERAENNTDEDYAAMEAFLVEAAEFFGFNPAQYEIQNMISQLYAELDGMRIYADDEMKTRIYFNQGVSLPSKYNLTKEASYEEKQEVAEYILKKYEKLIDIEDPQINVRDGDNKNISFFKGAADLRDRIVNYNFNKCDFYIDQDGLITMIIIYRPDLSLKVGDYPIISADEAKELLGEGHYYGAGNFPGVEWVKHVELIYDTGSSYNVYMPYYSFYAGSLYYVPAIDPQYITNMPVDGRYPEPE